MWMMVEIATACARTAVESTVMSVQDLRAHVRPDQLAQVRAGARG